MTNEIAYLHAWVADYKSNANIWRKLPGVGRYARAWDLYTLPGISLDWTGYFMAQNSPCALEYAMNEFVANPRHTITGIVLVRYHLSNFLTAYLARAITGWSEDSLIAEFDSHGNPDDQYDIASYRIGFAIYSGSTLEEAMNEYGYDSQEPDAGNWTLKLWPSREIPTGGQINRPYALQ